MVGTEVDHNVAMDGAGDGPRAPFPGVIYLGRLSDKMGRVEASADVTPVGDLNSRRHIPPVLGDKGDDVD